VTPDVVSDPFDPRRVGAAYDAAADDYVAAFGADLDVLPLDRSVLDRVVASVDGRGIVLDLGCGPGQVADYLSRGGVDVIGVDVSLAMLRVAARRRTVAGWVGADMQRLPLASATCAAVVCFYVIQHLPRSALSGMLAEVRRVLVPDGMLVVAAHLGRGEIVMDEFLGHQVEPLGGTFYGDEELAEALDRQHFTIEERRGRQALAHEYPSLRTYILARRSG
jgi:ubiquinone/menaquinone biosynthesis C-methylase UbiE